MPTSNQEHYINKFNSKIEAMDRESSKWGSNIRTQYENTRDSFKKQLDSWQDVAEDKWDDFKSSIDEAWMGVEEGWREFKKDGGRNPSKQGI